MEVITAAVVAAAAAVGLTHTSNTLPYIIGHIAV